MLPGMDELKSAGLLRKGIVLGGIGEGDDLLQEDEAIGSDEDLLETAFDETEFADET